MDMELAREYATAIAYKKKLEEQLGSIKDKIARLEDSVMNMMQEEQLDRLPINLGLDTVTLFVHRQLWARPKGGDKERVVRTLKDVGLGDLVAESYNTNSLSAYVREQLANGEDLEPELADVIDINEVASVRGRRTPNTDDSQTAKAMRNLKS
jgi:hypothetical protein